MDMGKMVTCNNITTQVDEVMIYNNFSFMHVIKQAMHCPNKFLAKRSKILLKIQAYKWTTYNFFKNRTISPEKRQWYGVQELIKINI